MDGLYQALREAIDQALREAIDAPLPKMRTCPGVPGEYECQDGRRYPDEYSSNANFACTICDGSGYMSAGCNCGNCDTVQHSSDCAVHNMPAYPNGACSCGAAGGKQ